MKRNNVKLWLTTIALLIPAMNLQAEIKSGKEGELNWTLDTETGALTISGNGKMNDHYPYKENNTFPWGYYNVYAHVKSVVIEEGVTSIGNYAFYSCTYITTIKLPSTIESIGEYAFQKTGLESISIPENVSRVGYMAFNGCSGLKKAEFASMESLCSMLFGSSDSNPLYYAHRLYINGKEITNAIIPDGIERINTAFIGCSYLTSVTLPSSLTEIGEGTFRNCSSLTSVTIPNSVTDIGNLAFAGCTSLTSVTIPNSVTSIDLYAFSNCHNLTELFLNSNAIVSNTYSLSHNLASFFGSNIQKVILGNNITSIGSMAFYALLKLKDVTISESVTNIEGHAFYGCSGLEHIVIPNSVIDIGPNAFSGCSSLVSVTIPNSVATISGETFSGCINLTDFNIDPQNAYYYSENGALYNKGKNRLIAYPGVKGEFAIPSSVTSINPFAFSRCTGLTSVIIPNSITTIDVETFSGCSNLTNITIPNSVTAIRGEAFYGCTNLTSIIIPHSVTTIESYAFSECVRLASVVSYIREPFLLEASTFSKIAEDCILTVPAGKKEVYIAQGWSEDIFHGGIVEMTPQVITLIDGAEFTNDEESEYDEINYTRTFNNTSWQSLYVPFEIPLTAELLEEFDFAYINGAKLYDYDDDGTPDDAKVEVFKMKSGTLLANMPYLIRAKETGTKTITVNEATLYATQENSIDCSTTALKFTFTGGYSTLGYDDIGGCYLLGGGTWNPVKEGGTMKPMRFYLKIESRDFKPFKAPVIRMTVFGEDGEATEVQSPLLQEEQEEAPIFDLQGRRVEYPENGIYIINGKKVIVK